MNLQDLQNDPFFIKFIQRLARMLGEYYQEKAPSMSNDELYEDSEFIPMFNSERDYSEKAEGYVCKDGDGTIMRLTSTESLPVAISEEDEVGSGNFWRKCWSKDPMKAKEFTTAVTSPYNEGECCIFEGAVYRATDNMVVDSPADDPSSWEKVEF